MSNFVFMKDADREVIRKILEQGVTISTVGKMIGNKGFLSRTNNKKTVGLDDFDSIGRKGRGFERTYYDDNVMRTKRDDRESQIKFNQALSDELEKLYYAGFYLGDIEYDDVEKIARVIVIFRQEDELKSTVLTFFDLKEDLPGIKDDDLNLIMIQSEGGSGESLLTSMSNKQEALFNKFSYSDDRFVAMFNRIAGNEYYETIEGDIFSTPSFYKKTHFGRMMKNVKTLSPNDHLSEKYIDAMKAQLEDYHFEFEGDVTNIDKEFFTPEKIQEFDDELVSSNQFAGRQAERYPVLLRHYSQYGKLVEPSIDEILDKLISKNGTFTQEKLDFAVGYFRDSDIEQKEEEKDIDNDGLSEEEVQEKFDSKLSQPIEDDSEKDSNDMEDINQDEDNDVIEDDVNYHDETEISSDDDSVPSSIKNDTAKAFKSYTDGLSDIQIH